MERRNLLAGLAVLALSLFLVSGTAFAHATHHKKAKPRHVPRQRGNVRGSRDCPTHSWTRASSAASSSIADIIEIECEEVYAEQHVRISANELYSRCDQICTGGRLTGTNGPGFTTGPSFSVELDNDGNATAIVIGGPSCAAGESLIAAHLEVAPVHDGDHQLHGAAAAADRSRACSPRLQQGRGRGIQRRCDDRAGRVPARVCRGTGQRGQLTSSTHVATTRQKPK